MGLFGKDKAQEFGQIKKYTGLFGSLFTDLYLVRPSGDMVEVPIRYGPGYIRNTSGNKLDSQHMGLTLPAMAFELTDITPDSVRRTAPYIRQSSNVERHEGGSNVPTVYGSMPHDLQFQLHVRCKNTGDCMQIIEQIIAAFNPSVAVTIIDQADVKIRRDITIYLDPSYQLQDNYEEQQDQNRFVEAALTFTLKGYLYKRTENLPIVLGVEILKALGDAVETWATAYPTPEQLQARNTATTADSVLGALSGL